MNQSGFRRALHIWQAEGLLALVARALGRLRYEVSHAARRIRFRLLHSLGRGQAEEELIRDSVEYWNRGEAFGVDVKDYSHWRGAGPWKDDERWLSLGRPHRRLYEQLCRSSLVTTPAQRIVEWGSGGGANAIHFIDQAREYCGVEISQASLDECRRVLAEAGFNAFNGVLISADAPEQALQKAGDGYDFFLCTYVLELVPSKAYGERIMRTACQMLRQGGLALVQIRYDNGSDRSSQKTVDYFRHCTRFTSYRVDEFWTLLSEIGFVPEFVWLAPKQTPEFSGDLYAYFGMRKPAAADVPSAVPETRAS